MTQFDDIRRTAAGAIDLDFYRTGATALRGQAMRDSRVLKAAHKFFLGNIAALAIVMGVASLPVRQAADQAGRWFEDQHTRQMQVLRERAKALANSDPQRWWDGYGMTPARSHAEAMSDLRQQIGETEVAGTAR